MASSWKTLIQTHLEALALLSIGKVNVASTNAETNRTFYFTSVPTVRLHGVLHKRLDTIICTIIFGAKTGLNP